MPPFRHTILDRRTISRQPVASARALSLVAVIRDFLDTGGAA